MKLKVNITLILLIMFLLFNCIAFASASSNSDSDVLIDEDIIDIGNNDLEEIEISDVENGNIDQYVIEDSETDANSRTVKLNSENTKTNTNTTTETTAENAENAESDEKIIDPSLATNWFNLNSKHNTWYVNTNHFSSFGSGNMFDPFISIGKALDHVKSDGDTLLIKPGVYAGPENFRLRLNIYDITIGRWGMMVK